MIGLLLEIHHNERNKKAMDNDHRILLGIDYATRRYGYLWALSREAQGKEWREHEYMEMPLSDNVVADRSVMGFQSGARELGRRLEDHTVEELIAEEKMVREAIIRRRASDWSLDAVIADVDNKEEVNVG